MAYDIDEINHQLYAWRKVCWPYIRQVRVPRGSPATVLDGQGNKVYVTEFHLNYTLPMPKAEVVDTDQSRVLVEVAYGSDVPSESDIIEKLKLLEAACYVRFAKESQSRVWQLLHRGWWSQDSNRFWYMLFGLADSDGQIFNLEAAQAAA